jgi:hypothetical protein
VKHLHISEGLTIAEFCSCEGISVPTFTVLRGLGLTPEETCIPGTPFVRITPKARREWREKMEHPDQFTGLDRCSLKTLRELAQSHPPMRRRGRPPKLQAAAE